MAKKTNTKTDRFLNEGLDKYATTEADHALFKALCDCGGDYAAMAVALGIQQSLVRGRLHKLRKKAALRGWSPNHDVKHETPEGFHVKGTSTLYGIDEKSGDQVVKAQWIKTDRDKEELAAAFQVAIDALIEPIRGKMRAIRRPVAGSEGKDIMVAYIVGDHHVGLYSWAEETGADYDLNISESILNRAFDRLSASAPPAEKAMVFCMGDFLHADNATGMTPRGGNILDTDGRYSKVIETAIRCMIRNIKVVLRKHLVVEVLIIEGNHDITASMWLAHLINAYFDGEPRVTVRTDPKIYKFTKWGLNLIGTTHGHCAKPAALPAIMAADVPIWWGETKFREFLFGHWHHESVKEHPGCTTRCVKVLAASDAYHAGAGYRSERGMEVAVYHKKQGRIQTLHGTVSYILDE